MKSRLVVIECAGNIILPIFSGSYFCSDYALTDKRHSMRDKFIYYLKFIFRINPDRTKGWYTTPRLCRLPYNTGIT